MSAAEAAPAAHHLFQAQGRHHEKGARRSLQVREALAEPTTQAYELSTLTGTQVLLLVVSETGLVYTYTTAKLQPLVTDTPGKKLIAVRASARLRRGQPC